MSFTLVCESSVGFVALVSLQIQTSLLSMKLCF